MIKTPVCYDSYNELIVDSIEKPVIEPLCGYYDTLDVIKRINMHDELVELLKESKYAISETYGIDSVFVDRVNNALERCK